MSKKEAAFAAADAGGGYHFRGITKMVREQSGAVIAAGRGKRKALGRWSHSEKKKSTGEDKATTGNRKAEPPTDCRQFRYYSFCSRSPVSHTRETPRTRAKMASS